MSGDFISGEYLIGEISEIRETSYSNERTKQTDHYRDIFLLIDHEDGTRTKERVRAPFSFDTSMFAIGKSFSLPVNTRYPYLKADKSLSKLTRSLRTTLPIMPAPPRARPQS